MALMRFRAKDSDWLLLLSGVTTRGGEEVIIAGLRDSSLGRTGSGSGELCP